jgi:taurine---2-oxoglutarate transaminase
VGMRPRVYEHFQKNAFWGGLTYNSHPLGCAAALGAIQAYEEDDMIGNARRMGERMRAHHRELMARHPSVGLARNIGLFGCLELIRDRRTMEPMAPFNGTSPEMKAVSQYLREHGLYTFLRWHTVMTNPPLCINEDQLAEGFGVIDEALAIVDEAVGA